MQEPVLELWTEPKSVYAVWTPVTTSFQSLQSARHQSNQSLWLCGRWSQGILTLRKDILLPAQLRRTKAERAEDVKLPSLTIKVHVCQMDEVEKDFYESLYMLTRAKFDGYVKKGSVLHNYAHIFELLSRLRQACDHPYLVVHSKITPQRLFQT